MSLITSHLLETIVIPLEDADTGNNSCDSVALPCINRLVNKLYIFFRFAPSLQTFRMKSGWEKGDYLFRT